MSLMLKIKVLFRYLFSFTDVTEDGGKGSLIAIEQSLQEKIQKVQEVQGLIAQQKGIYTQLAKELDTQESNLRRHTAIAQNPDTPENAALLAARSVMLTESAVARFKQNLLSADNSIKIYEQQLQDLQMDIESMKQEAEFAKLDAAQAEAIERMEQLAAKMELPSSADNQFKEAKKAIDQRGYTASANQELSQKSVTGQLKQATSSAANLEVQEKLRQLRGQ